MKFYRCNECGNIVMMVEDSGVNPVCCGQKMELLNANTVDAAVEKHVPVVEITEAGATVRVGSVEHPMTAEHQINWIVAVSGDKSELQYLQAGAQPVAEFGFKPEKVFAYCNLHGLWSA